MAINRYLLAFFLVSSFLNNHKQFSLAEHNMKQDFIKSTEPCADKKNADEERTTGADACPKHRTTPQPETTSLKEEPTTARCSSASIRAKRQAQLRTQPQRTPKTFPPPICHQNLKNLKDTTPNISCEDTFSSQCCCDRKACRCEAEPKPIKVSCEKRNEQAAAKANDTCCEELRYLRQGSAKNNVRVLRGRVQGAGRINKCDVAEKDICPSAGDVKAVTMATECEQCELQVKSTGDGVMVRCKNCEKVAPNRIVFPTGKPNKIIKMP